MLKQRKNKLDAIVNIDFSELNYTIYIGAKSKVAPGNMF